MGRVKSSEKTSAGELRTANPAGVGSSLVRSLKIAAIAFLLGLGVIAVASFLFREPDHLDMEYEGFD
jgi:hypothetical protein